MPATKRKITKKVEQSLAERVRASVRCMPAEHNEMIQRANLALQAYSDLMPACKSTSFTTVFAAVDAFDDFRFTSKMFATIPINYLLWISICNATSEEKQQAIYGAIGKSAYDFYNLTPANRENFSIWRTPISRNAQNLLTYNGRSISAKTTWKQELLEELIAAACFAATGRKMAGESQLIHGMLTDAMPKFGSFTKPEPIWTKKGLQPYTASFSPKSVPSCVMLFLTFRAIDLALLCQSMLLTSLRTTARSRRGIEIPMITRLLTYFSVSLCEDFEKSQRHASLFGNYTLW